MQQIWIMGVALLTVAFSAAATEPTQDTAMLEKVQAAIAATQREDDASREAYFAMPDTGGSGPYKSDYAIDPAMPGHVVFRPINLDALGDRKLAIIVWGNDECRDNATSNRLHLSELASHGYVIITPGKILTGPKVTTQPSAQELRDNTPKRTVKDVMDGLDWIIAENSRPDSPYFAKIDTSLVAAAGHSCGGAQAIQAGADPRVSTVIVHNSGLFTGAGNPITGQPISKNALNDLHQPTLYVLGGPTDIAYENALDDARRINHVPFFLADLDAGHSGTFRRENGGAAAQVARNWLEWQLRGDEQAARMFVGKDCTLCIAPEWRVQKKNIDS